MGLGLGLARLGRLPAMSRRVARGRLERSTRSAACMPRLRTLASGSAWVEGWGWG